MRSVVASSLVALVVGCSSSPRDVPERTGARASAIRDGVEDATHDAAVAYFVAANPAYPEGGFCSGALIAPNVVLTARHCLTKMPDNTLCEDLKSFKAARVGTPIAANLVQVVKSTNAYTPDFLPVDPVAVTAVLVPEDDPDSTLCGHDLALLVLAKPAAGVTAFEPRLDGPPDVGAAIVTIGYGLAGPGTDHGTRRSGSAKVASVGKTESGGSVSATEREWTADRGACAGDSGGPALDDRGRVIGVDSRGEQDCVDVKYTRVDVYADFLRTSVRDAASAAGIDPPAWAGTTPTTTPSPPAEPAPESPPPASAPSSESASSSGCALHGSRTSSPIPGAIGAIVGLAIVRSRRARRSRVRAPAK